MAIKKKKSGTHFLKEFLKSRLTLFVLGITLLCSLCIIFFFLNLKPFSVFPSNDQYNFEYYTDYANNGNSVIKNYSISDSLFQLDYELRGGFISPYVAIAITPKQDRVIDLTFYNRIVIEIEGLNTENIDFDINTLVKKSSQNLSGTPITFYISILDLKTNREKYVFGFKQLKVPDYWYANQKVSPDTEVTPDFKQVISFNVGTSYGSVLNEPRSFKVFSIRFERDNTQLIIILAVTFFMVVILLAGFHYFKFQLKNQKRQVAITYKPVHVQTKNSDVQLTNYINYINNHFDDTELSLEKTALKFSVSQRTISNTIQETFHCNFKSYINRLRIHEAKRLLKETDLTIGEIAFKVGFNTQSHFNRVFKMAEGINPSYFKNTDN